MSLRGEITCPCCGFKTLKNERAYEICSICFWEDDPYQREAIEATGANKVSLIDGQSNYLELGASHKDMLQYIRKPNNLDSKGEDWIKHS